MGTRKLRISYLADIDTRFVHFESKLGFYGGIPEDARVSPRYDTEGKFIGFIEGLREFEDWADIELPEINLEQAERHAKSKVNAASLP